VELLHIFRRVVEASQLSPPIREVLREPRVGCHALADIQEADPNLLDRLAILEPAVRRQPPGPLPPVTVLVLQGRLQPHQRHLFAVPFHRLSAGNFEELLCRQPVFGYQRQVLLAKELDVDTHVANRNLHAGRHDSRAKQALLQAVLRLL
jgi:hypothetical protein